MKDKKNASTETPDIEMTGALPVVMTPTAPQEKLSETDKLMLDVAKAKKAEALATAKEHLARNETAELTYRYTVLQLYIKYGMTEKDGLSENGDIVRGGNVSQGS